MSRFENPWGQTRPTYYIADCYDAPRWYVDSMMVEARQAIMPHISSQRMREQLRLIRLDRPRPNIRFDVMVAISNACRLVVHDMIQLAREARDAERAG